VVPVGVTPELIFASRNEGGLIGIRRVVLDITCDVIEESRNFYVFVRDPGGVIVNVMSHFDR
jgi:hypothetical protein